MRCMVPLTSFASSHCHLCWIDYRLVMMYSIGSRGGGGVCVTK